ncbi:MAG: hypothetical protein Ta2F_05800 [Termitinemataceae bacterium]|nr:MAG: hypothetical protein Ta2F_05800 [Termitinemataceae bacterium]
MLNILYNIIIYPVEQLIELCFLFVQRIFESNAIALCGVSISVSIFILPLYFAAEKLQIAEREIQFRLAAKISKIKTAFKGDEQYMILSAFYRQNHYHPVYGLRSSFGLLIQIPFFIAAYHYISHLEAINGVRFIFINDLGAPDGLFSIGGFNVNFLPVLMTAINVISAVVYTKGFPVKEKIQLYVMALLFLVLLYNSPAGLVVYWTLNNIFSLVKNIVQKTRYANKIAFGVYVLALLP